MAKFTEVDILSAHQTAVGEGNRGPGIDERVWYFVSNTSTLDGG